MSEFSEYVTSTAFHLRLSKVQIDCLCQIHQIGQSWMLITTFNALAGKGLVTRVRLDAERDHPAGATVRLTEAGEAIMPLLKLAGLYREFPKFPAPLKQPEVSVRLKGQSNPSEAA